MLEKKEMGTEKHYDHTAKSLYPLNPFKWRCSILPAWEIEAAVIVDVDEASKSYHAPTPDGSTSKRNKENLL